MSDGFKDHSNVAAGYQAFRPGYPPALFDWLAAVAPRRARGRPGLRHRAGFDVLAAHFDEVIALDPSAEQIAHAEPHPRVSYRVAPAEATGPRGVRGPRDRCSGPSLVRPRATSPGAGAHRPAGRRVRGVHLRSVPRRFADRRRRGSPLSQHPRTLLAAGARPCGRRLSDAAVPVARDRRTRLAIEESWTLERFIGYLGTWSAVSAYRRKTGADPLASWRARCARSGSAGADPKREVESHDSGAGRVGPERR